jgi:hypothetical protein
MDEALEKALDFSNFTSTLNAQKRILHEKYLGTLVMYSNNGKFTITTIIALLYKLMMLRLLCYKLHNILLMQITCT